MKFNSLAFRLVATAAAWTLIALPIVAVTMHGLISDLIMDGFDTRLRQHTWVLQSEAINSGREPSQPANMNEPLFGVLNSGWYWQIRPAGSGPGRTFVSNSLATARLPSPHETKDSRADGDLRWLDSSGPQGQPIRIVELVGTIGDEPGSPTYLFAVAGPLDWQWATINRFTWILALALALTGLALLAAIVLQVKVALRPLSVIEQGLSDIRTGKAERLVGEFPTEIEPLQVELNALMESNEDIIERARTQVGNLAHALKTPLAVLTNEADIASTPFAEKVAEQATMMNDQISHYLDRARIGARANTIGRSTPIAPVAQSLARALERIHAGKGVQIALELDDKLAFRGEKQDLEEMLGNLIDNAAKWAARNVTVAAAAIAPPRAHSGDWLRLTIEDDGPGVPASQRDEMMKRGRRLDESKPGSGLGMSIVHDLATTYRGRIELSQSDMGGLKVALTLPAFGR